MIRIFDLLDNNKLAINENCLLIPELKALMDKYPEDSIPVLSYVYFMTVPDSPYSNLEEGEKETMISEDVGGTFTLDDELILKAVEKLDKLYETPTMRYYKAIVKSMDNMSTYIATAVLTSGKDGNLDDVRQIQANAGKTIQSLKQLEKAKDEELKVALRGKAKMGMY